MTENNDSEIPAGATDQNGDSRLDHRLDKLDAELDKIRGQQATEIQNQQAQRAGSSGLAMAWRLGSEFISGVLVGGVIGWMIDTWFGVSPWGLIIFILLGFLAGMLNMLRSAGRMPPPGA